MGKNCITVRDPAIATSVNKTAFQEIRLGGCRPEPTLRLWPAGSSLQARRPALCLAPHFQYHASGRIAVKMADGEEFVAGPGEVSALPQGHDAWVAGDEPVVFIDWAVASNYAKQ